MGGATQDRHQRAAGLFADETPAAFLAGEFIRWLGEQDAALVRASLLHQSASALRRAGTLQHALRSRRRPGLQRLAGWREEAAAHPYVDYAIRKQKKSDFLPGLKGKVRDFGEDEFRAIRALYYGMISEVDAQLGRIWAAVKATGAWDDTIVILTSDHAEMMGDHFLLGKGGFFDRSFHIPLIVRDPRRSEGCWHPGRPLHRSGRHHADAARPASARQPPAHLDGRSLAPFLDGREPEAWRDAAHWEFDFRSIEKGSAERHFGLKPQQCNLAVIRDEEVQICAFRRRAAAAALRPRGRSAANCTISPDDPAFLPVRLELAERLLAWRAEHLDQSLALSALTEEGVVGAPAALPKI